MHCNVITISVVAVSLLKQHVNKPAAICTRVIWTAILCSACVWVWVVVSVNKLWIDLNNICIWVCSISDGWHNIELPICLCNCNSQRQKDVNTHKTLHTISSFRQCFLLLSWHLRSTKLSSVRNVLLFIKRKHQLKDKTFNALYFEEKQCSLTSVFLNELKHTWFGHVFIDMMHCEWSLYSSLQSSETEKRIILIG